MTFSLPLLSLSIRRRPSSHVLTSCATLLVEIADSPTECLHHALNIVDTLP